MKVSHIWWLFCAVLGITGGVAAAVGIWTEVNKQDTIGLYMLILSPFLLMFAGVCATLAAKFEAKEEQEEYKKKSERKK